METMTSAPQPKAHRLSDADSKRLRELVNEIRRSQHAMTDILQHYIGVKIDAMKFDAPYEPATSASKRDVDFMLGGFTFFFHAGKLVGVYQNDNGCCYEF